MAIRMPKNKLDSRRCLVQIGNMKPKTFTKVRSLNYKNKNKRKENKHEKEKHVNIGCFDVEFYFRRATTGCLFPSCWGPVRSRSGSCPKYARACVCLCMLERWLFRQQIFLLPSIFTGWLRRLFWKAKEKMPMGFREQSQKIFELIPKSDNKKVGEKGKILEQWGDMFSSSR